MGVSVSLSSRRDLVRSSALSTDATIVIIIFIFSISSSSSSGWVVNYRLFIYSFKKSKGSSYSIADSKVPEPIPVLGSQPAGDMSHKPGSRLPLLSARPAVTPNP